MPWSVLSGLLLGLFTSLVAGNPGLPLWPWWLLPATLFFTVRFSATKPFHARIAAFFICWFWGACHNAPPPSPREAGMVLVLDTPGLSSITPYRLVKIRNSHWLVKGRVPPGCFSLLKHAPARSGGIFHPPTIQGCSISPDNRPVFAGSTPTALSGWLHRTTSGKPEPLREWLPSFAGGDTRFLSAGLREAFRSTGLFHLLVVSGLHISILAAILHGLLSAPLNFSYSLLLLKADTFISLKGALDTILASVMMAFLFLTGAGAAAQRACLAFAVQKGSLLFWGGSTWPLRTVTVMTSQIVLFPLGFFSSGTLVSWSCWLLLLLYSGRRQPGYRSFFRALRLQCGFLFLAAAAWGTLPLPGLLINPAIVPLMPAIAAASLISLTSEIFPVPVVDLAENLLLSFLRLTESASQVITAHSWLAPDIQNYFRLRAAFFTAFAMVLLSFLPKRR